MKDSTAAKIVTVIANILTAAGALFLYIAGCLYTGPLSFWMGPKVIHGTDFILGVFLLIGCILLPIGINALLRLLHKRFGVSKKWAITPAVILSSVMGVLILIFVFTVGTGFFTAEWRW